MNEEILEYLIRSLTYKKSCLEIDIKKIQEIERLRKSPGGVSPMLVENHNEILTLAGKVLGLSIAISEIYKLIDEENGE